MQKTLLIIATIATWSCYASVWSDIISPDHGITISNTFETTVAFAGFTIATNSTLDLGSVMSRESINHNIFTLYDLIMRDKLSYTTSGLIPVRNFRSIVEIAALLTNSTAMTNAFIPTAGGTMLGPLNMGGNIITNIQDLYVDEHTIYYGGKPIEDEYKIPQTAVTAVWSTVYDWIQGCGSPGLIAGGEISYDTGSDKICISNGFGIFQGEPRDFTTSNVKRIKWFSWTNTCFTLPVGTTQYVYAQKTSGHPHIGIQDVDEEPTYFKWQLYRVHLEESGRTPYFFETYPDLKSYAIRDNVRLINVRNVQIGDGLNVSFATNFFHGGAGHVYLGNNKREVEAWNSDTPGNDFDAYYCTNSDYNVWVEIETNQLDNTYFNDAYTNLVASTNGAFLCHWLYWNTKNEPSIIYGKGQYDTLDAVRLEPTPSLTPAHFSQFCLLVCQVITTNGAENPIEIRTSGNFISGSATANSHSGLSDLTADDHPQYVNVNGIRPMTGNLNIGDHDITNVHNIIIGSNIDSNSYFTILQTMASGGRGCCAYMWGTNPPGQNVAVGPVWSGRRARGTKETPVAVSNDDVLVSLAARGHDGTSWSELSDGQIACNALEPFTATAHGTYWAIKTTGTGTTSRIERMRVDQWGIHGAGTFVTNVDAATLNGFTLAEIQAYGLAYYVYGSTNGPIIGTKLATLHPATGLDEFMSSVTNIPDNTLAGRASIPFSETPKQLHEGGMAKIILTLAVEGTSAVHNMRGVCLVYDDQTNLVNRFNGETLNVLVASRRENTFPVLITNNVTLVENNYFLAFGFEFINGWESDTELIKVYSQDGAYTRIELREPAAGVYALQSDLNTAITSCNASNNAQQIQINRLIVSNITEKFLLNPRPIH